MKKRAILVGLCVLLAGASAMIYIRWPFGQRNTGDGREVVMPSPWETHPSIYEHVKGHIVAGRTGLAEGGAALPDDEAFWGGSRFRWVPGGLDGAWAYHGSPEQPEALAASALDLIRPYCRSPSRRHKLSLYEWAQQHRTLEFADALLDALREEKRIDTARLHDLARSLAVESPDREPVKLGVVVLGLFGGQRDRDVFRTLGRHDEFTLFCVVALANTSDKPEDDLWELAKNVSGWGRVQAVRRLAETRSPRIKDWLLREGYRNSVMYEYLAYTCATSGGLRPALEEDAIDEELMNAAGDIISALMAGGPAENMDDYADGAAVVEGYLRHMAPRASATEHLLVADRIKSWLSDQDADWKARQSRGWTQDRRASLLASCDGILRRPIWQSRISTELQSEDEEVFHRAAQAADVLGMDTWQCHWDRLRKSPLKSGRWFHVMKRCDERRVRQVIALAQQSLPLEDIGSGPADEMGIRKQYEPHRCLDFVLQDLGRFPGHGVPLIEVGLRSPVVRNRTMALPALSQWGPDKWPKGIDRMLRDALAKEPEADLKEKMHKVLDGKSLD